MPLGQASQSVRIATKRKAAYRAYQALVGAERTRDGLSFTRHLTYGLVTYVSVGYVPVG